MIFFCNSEVIILIMRAMLLRLAVFIQLILEITYKLLWLAEII